MDCQWMPLVKPPGNWAMRPGEFHGQQHGKRSAARQAAARRKSVESAGAITQKSEHLLVHCHPVVWGSESRVALAAGGCFPVQFLENVLCRFDQLCALANQ